MNIKNVLIVGSGTLAQAARDADLVSESVPEDPEFKRQVNDDDAHRCNAAYRKQRFLDCGKLGMSTGEGYYSYPDPAFRQPGFLS